MRWIRDIALLLLLLGTGAGVVWWQMDKHEDAAKLDKTTADTQRLEREVRFRAATKKGELNPRGWPVTISPNWFETDPPQNRLVSDDRPWVEVASAEEAGLTHPKVRMTIDEHVAGFWYNPYQGVVRARVPVSVNDQVATQLYNSINQTAIATIEWTETPINVPKPNADKQADGTEKKDGEGTQQAAAPVKEPPLVVVHPPKKSSSAP